MFKKPIRTAESMLNALIIIIVVGVLWSVWGFFGFRVEQTDYTVTKKMSGYEVRTYPAHLVAQTTVEGSYDQALNEGFSIVAGYNAPWTPPWMMRNEVLIELP